MTGGGKFEFRRRILGTGSAFFAFETRADEKSETDNQSDFRKNATMSASCSETKNLSAALISAVMARWNAEPLRKFFRP